MRSAQQTRHDEVDGACGGGGVSKKDVEGCDGLADDDDGDGTTVGLRQELRF